MALLSQTSPTATIVARPYTATAWIRLLGDLDMAAEPALTDASDRLKVLTLHLIVIDLTAVTFVCSTFVNFPCSLHRTHPGAELVLHHPSPLAAAIVPMVGLDRLVMMTGVLV